MFSIESPQPNQYYWGGSDARSGSVPYGWSSVMWVQGNVATGVSLGPDQKARLGIKIPGDINWAGSTDAVQLCYSVGIKPGKGSVIQGTMWLSGYLCSNKTDGPEWIDKQDFEVDLDKQLFCGSFGNSSLGERWSQCDYVMVTLQTHENVQHQGYVHVSLGLSTWRKTLSGPL